MIYERMSDQFEKWYDETGHAIHHFTGADRGGPHDHPFAIDITIKSGGYTEHVYQPDGSYEVARRKCGDKFRIEANHIHEIVELHGPDCWTEAQYGPWERDVKFWNFDTPLTARHKQAIVQGYSTKRTCRTLQEKGIAAHCHKRGSRTYMELTRRGVALRGSQVKIPAGRIRWTAELDARVVQLVSEGLSLTQIGRVMDLSPSQVGGRLYRLRNEAT